MNAIFLIVDMQNDYCHKNGYYAKRDADTFHMDVVADRIKDVYAWLEDRGVPVVCFSIQYPEGDNPCVEGSWGAQYYGIEPKLLFHKTEFSCFSNPEFCRYLQQNGVKTIYICGFQTTFCVFNTLLSAVKLGYEAVLVEDLIGEREKHLGRVRDVIDYAKANAHVCISADLPECF